MMWWQSSRLRHLPGERQPRSILLSVSHRHVFLVQGSASVAQVLDIVLELSEQERCVVVRGIAEQCQVAAKVSGGGAVVQ